jgi:DNA-binding response OmpR family regulator
MKDILIVEDGIKERERLKSLFLNAGYNVAACDTVTEAEEELKTNSFRLAILDIGLSDKSGSYLFNTIKRVSKVNFIIIFTGNPSVHLKQRFIDEGATDYIVKASPEAQNERFLSRVTEIIGKAGKENYEGIDLSVFLSKYVNPASKKLFYDSTDKFPICKKCGSNSYKVIFNEETQMPPDISGRVICISCKSIMDPDIG